MRQTACPMMDHTLVIPTYNRPALLKRLVAYYHARAAGSMRLLVLDSSKPENAEQNAKSLSEYGDFVRHVVYPGTTPMASKLEQGLALVETRYASFCADDDLVFPVGLKHAIGFLDDHPDYASAHGLYLNFRVESNNVHITSEYAGPGNEAEHPGARIFRLFQRYESLFYGIFRTADLRDIFAGVAEQPTLHFQELFQSVAALIKGKIKRFPAFYAARQSCDPAEPERDKWQTYYWFADNPAEMLGHYRTYCDVVWRFYSVHGATPCLGHADFYKVMDMAHAVYFSYACPPPYFHDRLQALWPNDKFFEAGNIDMLDELPSTKSLFKLHPRRVWGSISFRIRALARRRWNLMFRRAWLSILAVCSAPAVTSLDRKTARERRTPWRCLLPVELRWLATVPEFRRTYLELCGYLDQT